MVQDIEELWDSYRNYTICVMWAQAEEKVAEEIFKAIMTED